jgi:hypothetical protein
MDYESIDYLRIGNEKQRHAYNVLTKNEIFIKLHRFDPILVGTIPINIDIEDSDLDIICYCKNQHEFARILKDNFGSLKEFNMSQDKKEHHRPIIASFSLDNFRVEIFGQDIPTKQQVAYRHMLIEDKLLRKRGRSFRQKIINLKRQGVKTEQAFGILLGLTGNAYEELLTYEV